MSLSKMRMTPADRLELAEKEEALRLLNDPQLLEAMTDEEVEDQIVRRLYRRQQIKKVAKKVGKLALEAEALLWNIGVKSITIAIRTLSKILGIVPIVGWLAQIPLEAGALAIDTVNSLIPKKVKMVLGGLLNIALIGKKHVYNVVKSNGYPIFVGTVKYSWKWTRFLIEASWSGAKRVLPLVFGEGVGGGIVAAMIASEKFFSWTANSIEVAAGAGERLLRGLYQAENFAARWEIVKQAFFDTGEWLFKELASFFGRQAREGAAQAVGAGVNAVVGGVRAGVNAVVGGVNAVAGGARAGVNAAVDGVRAGAEAAGGGVNAAADGARAGVNAAAEAAGDAGAVEVVQNAGSWMFNKAYEGLNAGLDLVADGLKAGLGIEPARDIIVEASRRSVSLAIDAGREAEEIRAVDVALNLADDPAIRAANDDMEAFRIVLEHQRDIGHVNEAALEPIIRDVVPAALGDYGIKGAVALRGGEAPGKIAEELSRELRIEFFERLVQPGRQALDAAEAAARSKAALEGAEMLGLYMKTVAFQATVVNVGQFNMVRNLIGDEKLLLSIVRSQPTIKGASFALELGRQSAQQLEYSVSEFLRLLPEHSQTAQKFYYGASAYNNVMNNGDDVIAMGRKMFEALKRSAQKRKATKEALDLGAEGLGLINSTGKSVHLMANITELASETMLKAIDFFTKENAWMKPTSELKIGLGEVLSAFAVGMDIGGVVNDTKDINRIKEFLRENPDDVMGWKMLQRLDALKDSRIENSVNIGLDSLWGAAFFLGGPAGVAAALTGGIFQWIGEAVHDKNQKKKYLTQNYGGSRRPSFEFYLEKRDEDGSVRAWMDWVDSLDPDNYADQPGMRRIVYMLQDKKQEMLMLPEGVEMGIDDDRYEHLLQASINYNKAFFDEIGRYDEFGGPRVPTVDRSTDDDDVPVYVGWNSESGLDEAFRFAHELSRQRAENDTGNDDSYTDFELEIIQKANDDVAQQQKQWEDVFKQELADFEAEVAQQQQVQQSQQQNVASESQNGAASQGGDGSDGLEERMHIVRENLGSQDDSYYENGEWIGSEHRSEYNSDLIYTSYLTELKRRRLRR